MSKYCLKVHHQDNDSTPMLYVSLDKNEVIEVLNRVKRNPYSHKHELLLDGKVLATGWSDIYNYVNARIVPIVPIEYMSINDVRQIIKDNESQNPKKITVEIDILDVVSLIHELSKDSANIAKIHELSTVLKYALTK